MTAYHPLTPAAGIAGVDEAGRGPLAGPLVVAAVVLDPRRCPPGLDDSKRLSERRRNDLFERIREQALAFHVECIAPAEIDRLNIYQATLHGMRRSLQALAETPTLALIDGNVVPPALPCAGRAIVKGDALEPAISAASILAKVTRDRLMRELHAQYPGYGFDRHMGYPTPEHLQRLREIGASDCHRRSFAPVREALQRGPEQALLSI